MINENSFQIFTEFLQITEKMKIIFKICRVPDRSNNIFIKYIKYFAYKKI